MKAFIEINTKSHKNGQIFINDQVNSRNDEKKAKNEVYSKLLKSGVEIEETARKYLTSE